MRGGRKTGVTIVGCAVAPDAKQPQQVPTVTTRFRKRYIMVRYAMQGCRQERRTQLPQCDCEKLGACPEQKISMT